MSVEKVLCEANPFEGHGGDASCYLGPVDGELQVLRHERDLDPDLAGYHDAFRQMVTARNYTCTGAMSAFRRDAYRFGVYSDLSIPNYALAHDLYEFMLEQPDLPDLSTFVACFEAPLNPDPREFHDLLFTQLQHLVDSDPVGWDPAVSMDPDSPEFSCSIFGKAWFLVGLHPGSSRVARTFQRPVMVFNSHGQFERLRSDGRYQPMQRVIRSRDRKFQPDGTINPNLNDHGAGVAEWRQASGLVLGPDEKCPLHIPESRRKAHATMSSTQAVHIEPQTGYAFLLEAGSSVRIIAPLGEQVADVMAFAADDKREYLSSGRTIDYNENIFVTSGSPLYSNRSRVMMTMTADTAGRHDFLLTPCSQEMFEKTYGVSGHHPSCFENLVTDLQAFDIAPDQIPTTLNVFMNVPVDSASGKVTVDVPSCKPGDYVDLRAEIDLVVGVTACSAEMSNNGTFKPIDLEIER